MPHVYSQESWARRRERAATRGYLQYTPWGHRYILVKAGYHNALLMAYQSMRLHVEHDQMTGGHHHYARLATRQAYKDGKIGDPEHRRAVVVHRAAGRLKHSISSKGHARGCGEVDQEDPVYMKDPWACRAVDVGYLAASSCGVDHGPDEDHDPWMTYRARRGAAGCEASAEGPEVSQDGWDNENVMDEAAESCGDREDNVRYEADASRDIETGSGVADLCMLVDVILNEAGRMLVGKLGAMIGRFDFEPLQWDERECNMSDVDDEAAAEEYACIDYEADLHAHAGTLQCLMREWADFERVAMREAECLALYVQDGGEEWWNDVLELAESLGNFASTIGSGCTYMNKEEIIEAVGAEFGDAGIVETVVDEARCSAGLGEGAFHAGAWTLLLGLRSHPCGVGERSGTGLSDDDGERSCVSAELWHDGGQNREPLSGSECG